MLSYANADRDNSTLRSSLYLLLTAEEYTFSLFATENGCPQSSLSPLTYAHFLRGVLYKGSQKNALSPSSPSYIIPLNLLFVKSFLLCDFFVPYWHNQDFGVRHNSPQVSELVTFLIVITRYWQRRKINVVRGRGGKVIRGFETM